MRFLRPILTSLFVLTISITACARPPAEQTSLRIAILPILDALPMYVAEADGLFEANGVKVQFIPVASAPERDQMLAAGQADGAVNETLAVMFFNKEKVQMQVVRFAHKATSESGHFFILASGQSGITEPQGLKGAKIGISQGTIIEYVTDRLLQAEGFSPDEIQYVAVPKIPDRINLLQSGELEAGVMPDPAAALAVMQGASLVLDDRAYPEYGASVISFRKEVIDQRPEAVSAFLAAIEQAVASINSNPSKYASLLSEKQLVPPPLMGSFQVPQFPAAGVPAKADWDDALTWARDKGLLDVDVSYADSVNGSLLP